MAKRGPEPTVLPRSSVDSDFWSARRLSARPDRVAAVPRGPQLHRRLMATNTSESVFAGQRPRSTSVTPPAKSCRTKTPWSAADTQVTRATVVGGMSTPFAVGAEKITSLRSSDGSSWTFQTSWIAMIWYFGRPVSPFWNLSGSVAGRRSDPAMNSCLPPERREPRPRRTSRLRTVGNRGGFQSLEKNVPDCRNVRTRNDRRR